MTELEVKQKWEEYYPKVYGYFFRRLNLRPDVEDLTAVTMTSFLEIFLDEIRLAKIENPNAYLWKIAHNQLVKFIDSKAKSPILVGFEENFVPQNLAVENLESEYLSHRKKSLLICMQKFLKPIELEIVKISILEDQKSQIVAQKLQLSSQNVRQKLSRSLKKIRENCRRIWKN